MKIKAYVLFSPSKNEYCNRNFSSTPYITQAEMFLTEEAAIKIKDSVTEWHNDRAQQIEYPQIYLGDYIVQSIEIKHI